MTAVEQREIEANGLRFETLLAGPESGEAVILLHGFPQSGEAWRDTVGWLADRGYRGVAPSLRGYSPGANPPEPSAYAMPSIRPMWGRRSNVNPMLPPQACSTVVPSSCG